jgi:methylenetetrahydrofolate reductase (NADPH)
MAHRMRTEQKLPSGTEVKGGIKLVLGAADVPIDPTPAWQPKALRAKMQAGADFVQTQFCMDIGVVRRYAKRLLDEGIRMPILVGVAPIPSPRSARWMREKLFGTLIPDAIIERLEKAADPKREGRRICVELLQQLAETPGICGAHVMAPMNFAEIPATIEESGVTRRKHAT